MSLKNLPEIKALNAPKGAQWEIPSSALERWTPGVNAATDDAGLITIYDGIGEQWDGSGTTSRRIGAALRSIGERDVVISLNSPGGDFFEGIAIYNLLREHKGKVTVKVVGLAASAASVIAMAADRLEIARAGFLMIHNAWSIVMGNRHDLADAIAVLEPFDATMADVYSARSGMDAKKIAKLMDDESWIGGSEAVEMKLADALLPADEIQTPEETKASSALRRVDIALAKQGITRSERRELLKDLTGTPSATNKATPCAGLSAALNDLKSTLQRIQL